MVTVNFGLVGSHAVAGRLCAYVGPCMSAALCASMSITILLHTCVQTVSETQKGSRVLVFVQALAWIGTV